MNEFFEKIKQGLEDAVAHKKSKITLRTEIIEISKASVTKEIRKIKKTRGSKGTRPLGGS